MLKAQLQNRAAVARASAHVPETLRCIRTIHTLRRENYMEKPMTKRWTTALPRWRKPIFTMPAIRL